MFLFRWGKKKKTENESPGSREHSGAKEKGIMKWNRKDQREKNINKEGKKNVKKIVPSAATKKKKKRSIFSLKRFNFFDTHKRKRTPRPPPENPKKEKGLPKNEVKSIVKKFETSWGGKLHGEKAQARKSATKVDPKKSGIKIDSKKSGIKADSQRSDMKKAPIENEDLFDILTEEERRSMEAFSLIDGSSNGDNSGEESNIKNNSSKKDVNAKIMRVHSDKNEKCSIDLKENDNLLKKKTSNFEGSTKLQKKKSISPPSKNVRSNFIMNPNSDVDPKKEEKGIETKKSFTKNIIKIPLSYSSSEGLKTDVLSKKESTEYKNEKMSSPEADKNKDSHEQKAVNDAVGIGNHQDDNNAELESKSEAGNHSGKMEFSKFIPSFNLINKKNGFFKSSKKICTPMIYSKLQIKNKEKSNIDGNRESRHSFDKTENSHGATEADETNITCQDIHEKKNSLIGRANLLKKKLSVDKKLLQEDGIKNFERKRTIDLLDTKISFNLHPPLLFTENSFSICPLSPLEDIIEVINSICNNSKEETISKLKMCKENNEKSSNMLKITLDKLNGPDNSVTSHLHKNMSLQSEYLMKVDRVMREINED
ncbi:hypothetical protein PGO_071650 [Plasmodium gonderi]|uniref:Uncharacterized protein n=1 Tax=Plasmodium gonderi TaxID=77519 RepID=A0A1Y1JDE0_PLAGO|nr:hypothetical protein PGO_071650 [Plasmodium gonderi]GAW80250.1 hypothetical protein PGO_071650 [Plasmodium gonderi]